MKKLNNINSICFRAALLPAFILVTLALTISGFLFKYHIDNIIERELGRHELINQLFIKSANADIIIGNEHSLYIMIKEYTDSYQLQKLLITKQNQEIAPTIINFIKNRQVSSSWLVSGISPKRYISIQSKIDANAIIIPLLNSSLIILLFIIASIVMFMRTKQMLHAKIIQPLNQTLTCDGNDISWFDKETAATEVAALYHRTNDFIRTLHQQRDVIDANNIKQAKYDIALQMAHDIRSPALALRTLIDLTDNLKDETKQLIRSVTYRISQISESLLKEYCLLSEQDKLLDRCRVVGVIVEDIFNEKTLGVYNNEISFSLSIDANSYHVTSKLPEEELARILDNLINNSIESIKMNGTIELIVEVEHDYIKIKIKDTGNGIPSEILPHVFDKGFTFNKERGNGLGLAYVKDLIQKYNGDLNLETSREAGTTIQICIPIIQFLTSIVN